MNGLTIFVASIKPCAILPIEFENSRFTRCNTTYIYSRILEMRRDNRFYDIPCLEPIEDLGLLRFADGKAVLVVILNLTTSMPIGTNLQRLHTFCVYSLWSALPDTSCVTPMSLRQLAGGPVVLSEST